MSRKQVSKEVSKKQLENVSKKSVEEVFRKIFSNSNSPLTLVCKKDIHKIENQFINFYPLPRTIQPTLPVR